MNIEHAVVIVDGQVEAAEALKQFLDSGYVLMSVTGHGKGSLVILGRPKAPQGSTVSPLIA